MKWNGIEKKNWNLNTKELSLLFQRFDLPLNVTGPLQFNDSQVFLLLLNWKFAARCIWKRNSMHIYRSAGYVNRVPCILLTGIIPMELICVISTKLLHTVFTHNVLFSIHTIIKCRCTLDCVSSLPQYSGGYICVPTLYSTLWYYMKKSKHLFNSKRLKR